MVRFRACLVIALAASIILCSAIVGAAGKKNKNNKGKGGKGKPKITVMRSRAETAYMKYAAAQLPNSRQAATRAKTALSSAVSEVRAAGRALQYSTENLERGVEQLERAERAAFQKIGKDDPFWESWARYEEARDKYQAATQQALSSEAYQAALVTSKSATNYGEAMANLRAKTLEEDPTVRKWRTHMRIAKDAVEAARRRIVDADPQWATAAFVVRAAREDVKHAENELDDALKKRMATRGSFNKAARAVAVGEAAKRQIQHEKKLNQGGKKKKGSSSKKSSPKKKKSGSKKKY